MYEIIYKEVEVKKEYETIIKKVISQCFKEENLESTKLLVTIILTIPSNIRQINKTYRNIDKETDVLSFPMFEKDELDKKINQNKFVNEDVLGDIIISIEQVEKQAKEYGHTFEREFSYMLVHGFYHLMGYDHIQEEDRILMREKEKGVIEKYLKKEMYK